MVRTQKELVELTKQLVAIESTALKPKGLKAAYEFVVQLILDSGKDITIEQFYKDGKRSLLAYRGPHRPENFRLIFNAHLDIVPGKPEQFKPFEENGRLYGRGTSDMKAAAIIMTDLFCDYVDKVPYALGLQVVTDEEMSGLVGTKYQIAHGVRADFIICGECGRAPGKYEIANASKGMVVVEVQFDGTAAHGAYLWKGDNALLRVTKFTHALLERYPVPVNESQGTTINVSSISTDNTAYTKVPDHAKLQLDIRYVNEDPNFRSPSHMAAMFEEIDPGVRVTNVQCFDAPLFTSPDNPLLKQLKAAAEAVEGHKFKLVRRHGTSDGRHYGNVGDQACEFGMVGEGHHADNEYVSLESFATYHKTLEKFLRTSIKSEALNTNTVAYRAV